MFQAILGVACITAVILLVLGLIARAVFGDGERK